MANNEGEPKLSSNSSNLPNPPSLKELTGFKCVIALFEHCKNNYKDIMDSRDYPELKENPSMRIQDFCNLHYTVSWRKIEEKMKHNLNGLQLPQSLMDDLINHVTSMEKNLRLWFLFLCAFNSKFPWEEEIFWAERGSIDWHKSIEKILNDEKKDYLQMLLSFCPLNSNQLPQTIIEKLKKDPFATFQWMCSEIEASGLGDSDYDYDDEDADVDNGAYDFKDVLSFLF